MVLTLERAHPSLGVLDRLLHRPSSPGPGRKHSCRAPANDVAILPRLVRACARSELVPQGP